MSSPVSFHQYEAIDNLHTRITYVDTPFFLTKLCCVEDCFELLYLTAHTTSNSVISIALLRGHVDGVQSLRQCIFCHFRGTLSHLSLQFTGELSWFKQAYELVVPPRSPHLTLRVCPAQTLGELDVLCQVGTCQTHHCQSMRAHARTHTSTLKHTSKIVT